MRTHKKYPFKFLDAYTSEDRDIFFGRTEEVDALYEMVFQSDLILIYGASGTGKSSLIQCGLASRFQSHDWLALNIRRGSNLNTSFERALQAAGGDSAASDNDLDWLDDDLTGDIGTPTIAKKLSPLAKSMKAIYLKHFKPIYLIFDQFEELYILGNKTEQHAFVETIRQVLRVEQPVKVILSIREEYLGYLYEFERKVPELLRKKLRVEPMNLDKVKAVINGVNDFALSNVHLQKGEEAAIAETIFEKIKGEEKTLHIQLPYLQVFLDKLYLEITGDEDRKREATISRTALQQMGDLGDVLRNFLDDQVLKTAHELQQKPETIWKILSPFVTLDGTKEPIDETALCDRLPKIERGMIRSTLQAFVQSRILRYTENEQLYEIAHDSLAKQIHAKRSDEEIALLEVQRLIKSQISLKEEAREFFTEKQLLFIEPFLDQFKLNAAEQSWMDKSEAHLQSQIAAEEAEKAQKLAKARKRTRVLAALLGFALIVAGVAGYLGYLADYQGKKAEQEKQNAIATLANLKKANIKTVKLLLGEIDRNIYQLEYSAALENTIAALGLEEEKEESPRRLQEIAYFYTESGQYGNADSALLAINLGLPDVSRASLLEKIRSINPTYYDSLELRYYPEMVLVPGGKYMMGREQNVKGHQVQVDSFWMAKTETTVWQYNLYAVANRNLPERPSWEWKGNNPIVNVSWYDAIAYSNWISEQKAYKKIYRIDTDLENPNELKDQKDWQQIPNWSADGYRLATEAEWEYAARGGPEWLDGFKCAGSNDCDSVAWYNENSANRTRPVHKKKANALGLYDMSGNVWEWCWDNYGAYDAKNVNNPKGAETGTERVLRGGSWFDKSNVSRVSYRNRYSPHYGLKYYGFRLARAAP